MDVNETLAQLRHYAEQIIALQERLDLQTPPSDMQIEHDAYASNMALTFGALDEWLGKGGFQPTDWQR